MRVGPRRHPAFLAPSFMDRSVNTSQLAALRSVVRGVGGYLPSNCVTNADLALRLETTDEWIVQRTGITRRHVAAEGETTSMLATAAAKAALEDASMPAAAVDLVIVATSTPD